ncbi:MAG: winged helix-turn-helix transcriptional regulator [Promethearchaeota archaeon]
MDNHDLRTLKILEEIEKDKAPSQRYLAGKLNISLGLVNSFIKRLAQKGLFKITTIPKNRVKYILTPKGATEKTRLTYKYIQYSFQFYKTARHKLRVLFSGLSVNGNLRIVFYGASDLAEIAYISLQETPIQLVGIVDDKKAGDIFMDFVILSSDRLKTISYDKILITGIEEPEEVLKEILEKGISPSKVIILE